MSRFTNARLVAIMGIFFMLMALVGCGGGGGGGGSTTPVTPVTPTNPTQASATVSGDLNPTASGAPGQASFQAAGEEFDVTLVDATTNEPVPATDLDPSTPNNIAKQSGQPYSFKLIKNFTKAYKVIAKGKSDTNKNQILTSFVGTLVSADKDASFGGRNVDPTTTAFALTNETLRTKDAASLQTAFLAKKDRTDIKKYATVIRDRKDAFKDQVIDFNTIANLQKLENSFKALLDAKTTEVDALKKGFSFQFSTVQKTLGQRLEEAKTLVSTDALRKNETFVKDCVEKLNGTTGLLKDANLINATTDADKKILRDAKLLYGCAQNYYGKLLKNKGTTAAAASLRAPSLMAAYGAMNSLAASDEATNAFKAGYDVVKDLPLTDADKAEGKDKELAGVILMNATQLAKAYPEKVDEAKKKAQSIIAKMEYENTGEILLPSGETLDKDEIYATQGEACINGGRPSEAVDVFQKISETGTADEIANKQRMKKFGLGRAFLQLNDIKSAYENLRDTVQDVVKTSTTSGELVNENNSIDKRTTIEEKFAEVNEALFAFAAVMDKLLTDTTLAAVRTQIDADETAAGNKIISGASTVTVIKIVEIIKPTTSFYQVASNVTTTGGFGNQFANVVVQTDENKKKFEDGLKMLTKARAMIENYRAVTVLLDKQKAIYGDGGTVENPLAGSVLKLINDARVNFYAVYNAINAELPTTTIEQKILKADAYFQYAITFIAEFRALEIILIVSNDKRENAKRFLYEIKSYLDQDHYAHLSFTVSEMIRSITEEERAVTGSNAVAGNADFDNAQKSLTNAENLYFDGEKHIAFAEFQKALDLFIKIYKDATVTPKFKELSLYFSGYCLFNQYNSKDRADEASYTPAGTTAVFLVKDLKVKGVERLKLFLLKYPNSDFAQNARDMVNDLNSAIAGITSTDIGGTTPQIVTEYPGVEFTKATGALENLRFMYGSGVATAEVDAKFNFVNDILTAIADQNTTETKLMGTFQLGGEKAMHFRNYAYFMLGLLNMDRYLVPMVKNIKYKNRALEIFNHLILEHADESFIISVRDNIAQLENNGVVAKFDSSMPVITNLRTTPAFIDRVLTKTDVLMTVEVEVALPDAAEGVTIAEVKGVVKQYGREILDTNNLPFTIVFTNEPAGSTRWVGAKTIVKEAQPGKYDFELTAKSSVGKVATVVATFIIKGEAGIPQIAGVNVETPNGSSIFKVRTNMAPATDKYTDIFVDILSMPEAGSYNTEPIPVYGFQNVKLERDPADSMLFLLDQAKKLAKLEAGKNYMFLFKVIKFNPYNPTESLVNPIHVIPFNFALIKEVAAADRETVLAKYMAILSNFNDLTLTAMQKAEKFNAMHVQQMSSEEVQVLADGLGNLRGGKVMIPAGATTNIEYKDASTVIVRAPWEISGYYIADLPYGIYFADGEEFLPPGRAGFFLRKNVNGDQLFKKIIVNGVPTWKIGDFGYEEMYTPPADLFSSATVEIISIGQKDIVMPVTAPIDISEYKVSPIIEVRGRNLNPSDPQSKRFLQIVGPSAFPIILVDNGSPDWSNLSIFFPGSALNGLSGIWQMQLFDTKYGPLFSFPINLGTAVAGTNPFQTKIFTVRNGTNDYPVYGLNQPVEIDATKDLSILGEGFVPGNFALTYFNNGTFSVLLTPATTDWQNYWVTGEIKLTGTKLTQKLQGVTLPLTSMLVIRENTFAGKDVSISIPVTFFSQAPTATSANLPAIINTVNGVPADTLVVLKKDPASNMLNVTVRGMNLKSYSKRHLDLVFQFNGMPVHVPIAFSTNNAGWQNESITAVIDLNAGVPVIFPGQEAATIQKYMNEYPTGLVIWDDAQGCQVNPYMVNVKLLMPYDSATTVAPYINKVNGNDFNGVPVVIAFESGTDESRTVTFGGYNFGPRTPVAPALPRSVYMKDMPTPYNPEPIPQKFDVLTWEFDATSKVGTISVRIMNNSMNMGMKLFSIAEETANGPVLVSNEIPFEIKVKTDQPIYTVPVTEFANIMSVNGASTAQMVQVPIDTTTAVFLGSNLRSRENNYRVLFARTRPTELVPYPEANFVMDSYSADWTDTAITLREANPEPGIFEMYIAEPQFNNRIVSNVILFSFTGGENAPVINHLNSMAIPGPGMNPLIIDPYKTPVLTLHGLNFGTVAKQVAFIPYPTPMNYNPERIMLKVISWAANEIKVSTPVNATLNGGELAIVEQTSTYNQKFVTAPFPIVFQTQTVMQEPRYVDVPYLDTNGMRKVLVELADNPAYVNSGLAITSAVDLRSTPSNFTFVIDQIVLSRLGTAANADGMKDDPTKRVELFSTRYGNQPIVYSAGNMIPVDVNVLNPIPNGEYNYLIMSMRHIGAEGMFANDTTNYFMPPTQPNIFGFGQAVTDGAAQIRLGLGTTKMDGVINLTTAENKIKLVFTPKDIFARIVADPTARVGRIFDLRFKPFVEYQRVVELIQIDEITNMFYDFNNKKLTWNKLYVEGQELPYRLMIDGVVYGDVNRITTNEISLGDLISKFGVTPGHHQVQVQAWIPGDSANPPKYGPFNPGISFFYEKPIEYITVDPIAPGTALKSVGLQLDGDVTFVNNDLFAGPRILGRATPSNLFMRIEQIILSNKPVGTRDSASDRAELFRSGDNNPPIYYNYPGNLDLRGRLKQIPARSYNYLILVISEIYGNGDFNGQYYGTTPLAGPITLGFSVNLAESIFKPALTVGATQTIKLMSTIDLTAAESNNLCLKFALDKALARVASLDTTAAGAFDVLFNDIRVIPEVSHLEQTELTVNPVNMQSFYFDPTSRSLSWQPEYFNGMPLAYELRFDGQNMPITIMDSYFYLPYEMPAGDHTMEIVTVLPGSEPPVKSVVNSFPFYVPGASTPVTTMPIPPVQGVVYDPINKMLNWQPVTGDNYMTYCYNIEFDGNVMPDNFGMNQFYVGNYPGTHEIRVRAMNPDPMAMYQYGPFSEYVSVMVEGTGPGLETPTGLYYDAMSKSLAWNPVFYNGQYCSFHVFIDGYLAGDTPSPYYNVMTFPGSHQVQISAFLPGSVPMIEGPMSVQIMFDNIEGGTQPQALPTVPNMGVANNTVAWDRFAGTLPAGKPFLFYYVAADGMRLANMSVMPPAIAMVPDTGAQTYTLGLAPYNLITGNHTIEVQACAAASSLDTVGVEIVAVSQFNAFITSTTSPSQSGIPVPECFVFDGNNNIIKWAPVFGSAGEAALYRVELDGAAPVPAESSNFGMPNGITLGNHYVRVQAVNPTNTSEVSAFSPVFNFNVFNTQNLWQGVARPATPQFDAINQTLTCNTVADATKYRFITYQKVNGLFNEVFVELPSPVCVLSAQTAFMALPAGDYPFAVKAVKGLTGSQLGIISVPVVLRVSEVNAVKTFVLAANAGTVTRVPPTGIQFDNVTKMLFWNPVTGAVYYNIYLDGYFLASTPDAASSINLMNILPTDGLPHLLSVSTFMYGDESGRSYDVSTSGQALPLINGVGVNNGVLGWNAFTGVKPAGKPFLFYIVNIDGLPMMDMGHVYRQDGNDPLATNFTVDLKVMGVPAGTHSVEVLAMCAIDGIDTVSVEMVARSAVTAGFVPGGVAAAVEVTGSVAGTAFLAPSLAASAPVKAPYSSGDILEIVDETGIVLGSTTLTTDPNFSILINGMTEQKKLFARIKEINTQKYLLSSFIGTVNPPLGANTVINGVKINTFSTAISAYVRQIMMKTAKTQAELAVLSTPIASSISKIDPEVVMGATAAGPDTISVAINSILMGNNTLLNAINNSQKAAMLMTAAIGQAKLAGNVAALKTLIETNFPGQMDMASNVIASIHAGALANNFVAANPSLATAVQGLSLSPISFGTSYVFNPASITAVDQTTMTAIITTLNTLFQ